MSDKALRELAEITVQNPVAARAPLDELRARNRRRQRGRVAVFSAVLVVVIAVVSGAIWLRAEDRSTLRVETKASSPTTPNTPSTLSPAADPLPNPVEPVERARSGVANPVGFAVRGDTLWVLAGDAACGCSELHALDAITMRERAKVQVRQSAIGLATNEDGVWVLSQRADGSPIAVTLVEPADLHVRRVVELPQRAYGMTNPGSHITATSSGAWIGLQSTLVRVEVTGKITQFPLDVAPYRMASDSSSIWIAAFGGPEVVRVNAADGAVLQTISIPQAGFLWSVAASSDAAWVTAIYPDPGSTDATPHLVRIDADTYELRSFTVPAVGVAEGYGEVWIQTEAGYVAQIDPSSGAILRSLQLAGPTPVDNPQFSGPTLFVGTDTLSTGVERVTLPHALPAVPPSSTPRSSEELRVCLSSQLEMNMGVVQGASAEGITDIIIRNASDQPCRVYGTPQVDVISDMGYLYKERNTPRSRLILGSQDGDVQLQPGDEARFDITWTRGPELCASKQYNPPAKAMRVTLSGTDAVDVPAGTGLPIVACDGLFAVSPVYRPA